MNKRRSRSARAAALQFSLAIILLSASTILFATSFMATPRQVGEAAPTPTPPPETVTLPVAMIDVSLPSSTVVLQPITTTNITTAEMYLGFQGDFTFDSSVINFADPVVVGGGLTDSGWNVSGNVLNTGPGTMKTLRVSAFVQDGQTPLSGEGTLYNLRMVRVSNNVGASTPLNWRLDPDNFFFIDQNLAIIVPTQTNGAITIGGMTPTPTPAGSPTPPFEGGTLLWEGFDTAQLPALPSGWQSSFTPGAADCTPTGTCGLGTQWVTSPANPYSGPISAFHDAPGCVTDSVLDTRQFFVPFINTIDNLAVSFRQSYNFESGRDGGVLEISIDGGPFTDIVAAGGFINYSGTISTAFLSPIGGRQAFTGNSGGYIWTFAGLPHSAIGRSIVLRFRLATDCSGSGMGWFIDEVFAYFHFNGTPFPSPTTTPPLSPTISPTPTPTSSPLVSPCPGCTDTPTPTPFCATAIFSNQATITIPASGSSGIASPYPSTITVSGLGSSIARVSVRLHGFTHSHPKDIDMLLVGPQGQNAIIMSDAGGYGPIIGLDFQITPTSFPMPNGGPLFGDTFGAANWADCDDAGDVFPGPAPTPSGFSVLGIFDGTNPNGTWGLYVVDDKDGNGGVISGGWDLIVITAPCPFPSPTPFPGPTHFEVVAPSAVTAGVPFSFYVRPTGGGSETVPYPGTIHFTSSDPSAVLPPDATATPGGGTPRPFTATLNQVSTSHTISVNGVQDPLITGTSNCVFVQPTPTPTPTPTATESPTPSPSPTPTVPKDPGGTPTPIPIPARAQNLSTRLNASTGGNVGIGGFIITGNNPIHVLIRGLGPSLGNAGVSNSLADPVLELHGPAAFATVINNNWRDTQGAEISATGIPPPDDLESAILATLDPGAYTAILKGNNDGVGIGLVEIYDLDQLVQSKLGNLSTRAVVGTGNDIVISGFILGAGLGNDLVLLRGLGPSLNQSGITNTLADPILELRNSDGAIVAMNDNWQTGPPVSLPPTDPLESAIEMSLAPGAYTALLSGMNSGTGVGLVEVYDRGTL